MKNNIAIFGNSLFVNTEYKNDEYIVIPNKITSKLNEKYNVDNFSSNKLTAEKSIKFLKAFVHRKYKKCIISLGEADYNYGNLESFKNNIINIIHFLKINQILPLLVGLPAKFLKKNNAKNYQEALNEIAKSENVTYIYSGQLTLENQYIFKNDSQLKRILVNLCSNKN